MAAHTIKRVVMALILLTFASCSAALLPTRAQSPPGSPQGAGSGGRNASGPDTPNSSVLDPGTKGYGGTRD